MKWTRSILRYALPFLSIAGAMAVQVIVQHFVPAGYDFPFAFFYLVAAIVSAWYGGYVAGVLSCTVIIIGLPLASRHGAELGSTDVNRLILFIIVSILISRTAQMERRSRQILRHNNDELDRRVQEGTRELAQTVVRLKEEIVERHNTEIALRESESRIEFSLDAAGIGRLDLDLKTGIANRSPRHDEIFGYNELQSEWTYSRTLHHVIEEDRAEFDERVKASVQTGNPLDVESRILASDHSIRWISTRGRIQRDESGNAVSMLGIVTDVTDSKLAEQRLRTQLQRLGLLDQITRAIGDRQDLRSIFQVVVRTLEDNLPIDFGCVFLHEPDAHALTIACVGSRGGETGADLVWAPEARIPVDENALSRCVSGHLIYESDLSRLPFPLAQRLCQADLHSMVAAPFLVEGSCFGILLAARRAPDSFSSGECEFLRQLSEHVALASNQGQMYAALQAAYDDLRQTQQVVMQQERLRALGQMASGIAHDINNALSPVSLYADALMAGEKQLSPKGRRQLETIQRAIDDIAHTVARMREFYRQDPVQPALLPVDLGQLLDQVLDLTRARWSDMAQQRGILILPRVERAPSLPLVGGIESEIREALINLIFNAIDAMPAGGTLTLRTKARHSARIETSCVELEVEDTGIGMDEDTRRRCLEPFFTTKGERGTGLGLAMVYGVAQRHNAQIEIDSAPGVGSTMRLRFPLSARLALTTPPETVRPALAPMRILVVDDDPLLIKSITDALELDGHQVVAADGGRNGIEIFMASGLHGDPFSAVLTDLGMPRVDGRKVAEAIKEMSPSTPVILLTGWGNRLLADGEVPPHVDRVLSKPPKMRDLRDALAELVPQNKQMEPIAEALAR
jgi:PAS domain S-box-containing protein